MSEFKDATFAGGSVDLDGHSFLNCRFEGTELRFFGRSALEMDGCALNNIRLAFGDNAALTLEFLSALYSAGKDAEAMIEGIFEQIRKGDFSPLTRQTGPSGKPKLH